MTFRTPPYPAAQRPQDVQTLSADNGNDRPFAIMKPLREAAAEFGLKPPVLATLEAMLSCLAPNSPLRFVFASNATLAFKRNGITDRTVRRHIAILEGIGFLRRIDSPNRKRFTKLNPQTGEVLRFGFDLTPLFAQRQNIEDTALRETARQQAIGFLKLKLRAALHAAGQVDNAKALSSLRRNLSIDALQQMLAALPKSDDDAAGNHCDVPAETQPLSAAHGQNVRHHQRSNKEEYEDTEQPTKKALPPALPTLSETLAACPSALEYAYDPIATWSDLTQHARRLAPMMGIDRTALLAAEHRIGSVATAKVVLVILQLQSKIRQMGAYFRSVTIGRRADQFCPDQVLQRLLKQKDRSLAIA